MFKLFLNNNGKVKPLNLYDYPINLNQDLEIHKM